MAKLTGPIQFIGTIDGITAYKNQGSEDIFVRKTGSPSKTMIKTHPNFDNTRRNNIEFGGRSTTSKYIRYALRRHKPLADGKLAGKISGFIMPLHKEDTESEWGKRSLCLSKNPQLLKDFNLNTNFPFDNILKGPLSYSISRNSLGATISIPSLHPGIDLFLPDVLDHFSFLAGLGIVPDIFFNGNEYGPTNNEYCNLIPDVAQSEWFKSSEVSPAITLDLALPQQPIDNSFSLMLTIGICFGKMNAKGKIVQVEKVGSAKIVDLA